MKFSLLPFLVAGFGLAVQQASASPIRVVVVSDDAPVIRFGHAVAPGLRTAVDPRPAWHRRPCAGMRFQDKAVSISNTFRKALGLPLIETASFYPIHILPMPIDAAHAGGIVPPHIAQHTGPYHGTRHSFHHHRGSFFRRIHHVLVTLGPWESRAVAFVLGCGIGVLLRMFWVLTVITYRIIKGDHDEAPEYKLVCEHYAEEVLAPPQYINEKAPGDVDVDAKPSI
jgi:hypothetical protein